MGARLSKGDRQMCAVRARGLSPDPQRDADPILRRRLSGSIGVAANDNRSPPSTLANLMVVAAGIALLGLPLLLVALGQL